MRAQIEMFNPYKTLQLSPPIGLPEPIHGISLIVNLGIAVIAFHVAKLFIEVNESTVQQITWQLEEGDAAQQPLGSVWARVRDCIWIGVLFWVCYPITLPMVKAFLGPLFGV